MLKSPAFRPEIFNSPVRVFFTDCLNRDTADPKFLGSTRCQVFEIDCRKPLAVIANGVKRGLVAIVPNEIHRSCKPVQESQHGGVLETVPQRSSHYVRVFWLFGSHFSLRPLSSHCDDFDIGLCMS